MACIVLVEWQSSSSCHCTTLVLLVHVPICGVSIDTIQEIKDLVEKLAVGYSFDFPAERSTH
jgi:hypothetical protein